jgi:hypothetical protein
MGDISYKTFLNPILMDLFTFYKKLQEIHKEF